MTPLSRCAINVMNRSIINKDIDKAQMIYGELDLV